MESKPQMDTRWSWVVLACCWISLFLFSLVFASAGILQVEMMEDFQVGSGPVAIIMSLATGLSSLMGPVSGVLASLLSIRWTVFLGVALIAVGDLCASFCYSIKYLLFFYGILTGLGVGIAYSPTIVVISLYFRKHLMVATGILMCSPGLGYLCIPYFIRYVIDTMGWRYCLALNGALTLHAMVCAAILVPTETEKASMIRLPSLCFWRRGKRSEELDGSCNGLDAKIPRIDANELTRRLVERSIGDGRSFHSNDDCRMTSSSDKNYDFLLKRPGLSKNRGTKSISISSVNKPYIPVYVNGTPEAKRAFQPLNHDSEVTVVSIPNNSSARDLHVSSETLEDGVTLPPLRDRSVSALSDHSLTSTGTGLTTDHHTPRSHTPRMFGQLRKGGSHRSFLSSNIRWASQDIGSTFMLPIKVEEMSSTEGTEAKSFRLKHILKRVCCHAALWVLNINGLLFFCGNGVQSIHLPAYARSKGATHTDVSHSYGAYGLGMMLGRLAGGFVYNRVKPPMIAVLFVVQCVSGLLLGLAPFYATTVPGLYVMQGATGVFYGQSYMLLAPIITEMLGVGDLPVAFGLINMFVGIGYIVSPIFAGFTYDATQTYDVPMEVAGAIVVLGSTLLFFILCLKKEKKGEDLQAIVPEVDAMKTEPMTDQSEP